LPPAGSRLYISYALVLVELLHQAERALEFVRNVGVELDAGLEPPEQVGRQRQIAQGGPMVAFAANALVDPEYLLDHDDRAARLAVGLGQPAAEAAVPLERRDVDRRHAFLLLRSGGDYSHKPARHRNSRKGARP
jgi:hypothetical protein